MWVFREVYRTLAPKVLSKILYLLNVIQCLILWFAKILFKYCLNELCYQCFPWPWLGCASVKLVCLKSDAVLWQTKRTIFMWSHFAGWKPFNIFKKSKCEGKLCSLKFQKIECGFYVTVFFRPSSDQFPSKCILSKVS